MIKRETIDLIIDAAHIEEVIGEYVALKKRGANYVGLSPFQNEKSPSFTVSPSKGIFKDFSSGKAGNVVSFLMEHEKFSYPEALRFLANKYNIEIEESVQTEEEKQATSLRESIFIANKFATDYFKDNLWHSDEGKSVALSYFRDRGLTDDTIAKFELGYAFDDWTHFTNKAINEGYNPNILTAGGLIGRKDGKEGNAVENFFDFFKARVLFPVHNISGRVVGFSGRTLSNDKNIAKYKNSPDTEVYHKSAVLFGLYFAKKAITQFEKCYLVEGNLDLIALHQAGIENTVAPLGTALTIEQVRLIRKYTNNIIILFDGDKAGIKASIRAIDMVLGEGMNVKVLLLPEGEDPDSYSRKVTRDELKNYLETNAVDFISFKAQLLQEEAKNDPIKKAEQIKSIVESIALIPDGITRSVYVKECARIMQIDEQTLLIELNKVRRKQAEKPKRFEDTPHAELESSVLEKELGLTVSGDDSWQDHEKEIVRLLLNYGDALIDVEHTNEEEEEITIQIPVAEMIIHELQNDQIELISFPCKQIFDEYKQIVLKDKTIPHSNYFVHHPQQHIQQYSIDLINISYTLSARWEEKHNIYTVTEDSLIKQAVYHTLYSIRIKRVQQLISENQEQLKTCTDDAELMNLLELQRNLQEAKIQISAELGRIVLK